MPPPHKRPRPKKPKQLSWLSLLNKEAGKYGFTMKYVGVRAVILDRRDGKEVGEYNPSTGRWVAGEHEGVSRSYPRLFEAIRGCLN